MVVLILTNKFDITSDFIVSILKKQNFEFIRINTEDLIEKTSTITFPNFTYSILNNLQIKDFKNKINSVLIRRPGKPYEFSNLKPLNSTINFIQDQWYSFISGLEIIPEILWINNPRKNSFAEIKINQLYFAHKIGLTIPKTCITSDRIMLERFWNECSGNIISKALYSPLIKENNQDSFIFTNKITSIDNITIEEMLLAPTIFQEEIHSKTDYRVTVIDKKCFTVKITGKNLGVDWRTAKQDIKYTICKLPKDIEEKCIKLVSDFKLVFAAIDIVESNNQYYFLEINPNGEWGWLQKSTELPIAETLVEKLTEEVK